MPPSKWTHRLNLFILLVANWKSYPPLLPSSRFSLIASLAFTLPERFWQSVRCRAQTEHSYYFTLFLEVLETRRGERKGEIGDVNKKNKWEIWWRGRDWFSKWNSRWERKFPTSLLGRTTVRWLREFWVCGATVWAASNQHNRNAAVKRVQLLNWESG